MDKYDLQGHQIQCKIVNQHEYLIHERAVNLSRTAIRVECVNYHTDAIRYRLIHHQDINATQNIFMSYAINTILKGLANFFNFFLDKNPFLCYTYSNLPEKGNHC